MAALKHHATIGALVINALPMGMERLSQSRFRWDISGQCERPGTVELHGRPASDWIRRHKYVVIGQKTKHSLIVEMTVSCRKCSVCLKRKATMWIARAMHEVRNARRTWFATYTFRPEGHYKMQCRALAYAEARSIPTHELTNDEVSLRQSNECGKELTLMFKRIRKELPQSSVRYLLVREKHKSGLPHWHALIHESGEVPISYRLLSDNWTWGHSRIKLIGTDEDGAKAAFYVAKYLAKSNEGRVRASIRYGRWDGKTSEGNAVSRSVLDVPSHDKNDLRHSEG